MAGQPYITVAFKDGSRAILWSGTGLWVVVGALANDVRCEADRFAWWRNGLRRCWVWAPSLWNRLKYEAVAGV